MDRIRHLLFALLLASLAYAWEHAASEELRELLSGGKRTLVAFVFPSQKSSQSLEAEWDIVQRARTSSDATIISIDCSTNMPACADLDVASFPTIRLYHAEGHISRYRGPRKSTAILSFLRRTSRPVISQLTPSDLPEFITSDDVVLTASFPADEAPLYEYQFRDLAREYRNRYSFAILSPASETKPVVRCRNNPNQEDFSLREAALGSVAALRQLVAQCSSPLVLDPSRAELARLGQIASERGVALVAHFFGSKEKEREAYRGEVLPLAKRYKGEVLFTVIDSAENPAMPGLVGLGEGGTGVAVESLKTGEVFRYQGDIEEGKLERFLGDVVRGGVKAWGHDEL